MAWELTVLLWSPYASFLGNRIFAKFLVAEHDRAVTEPAGGVDLLEGGLISKVEEVENDEERKEAPTASEDAVPA